MLGVQDRYNMCLFQTETVELICNILLRYMFVPLIQIETNEFQKMVRALIDGMSTYLPFMTYDVQMFKMRRIAGIPGYQYNADRSKELLCRSMFCQDELNQMKEMVKICHGSEISNFQFLTDVPILGGCVLEAADASKYVEISSISHKDWNKQMSDIKFWQLSAKDRRKIRIFDFVMMLYDYRIGRWIIDMSLSVSVFFMRRFMNSSINVLNN